MKKIKTIISIVGKISSGKTTVANAISNLYDIPIASFGGYLRYFSEKNNLSRNRESLQNLGEKMVQEQPEQFLKNVINYYLSESDTIILDGVRHTIIMDTIKKISDNSILIYVDTPFEVRVDRYNDRENFKNGNLALLELDKHEVESETELLKSEANIVATPNSNYIKEIGLLLNKIL